MKNKFDELYNYGKYYKWFVALFTIGCICILISLFFIPVFFIMPKKLATWLNLGFILILVAFGI